MHSRNPVFARSDTFSGRSAAPAQGAGPAYPGAGPYQSYGQPSGYGASPGYGPTGHASQVWGPPETARRMTLDDVVARTGITLGVLVITAALTWVLLPNQYLGMAWIGGALVGLGLGLVLSFKRVASPGLVMAYAVFEGLFIGAASETFESTWDGVVPGAVLGTLAAFAATLTVYKVGNVRVSSKFRKVVVASVFGFMVLSLLDFVLYFFGANFGFNGFGTLGLLSSIAGVVLGCLMLILDFDYIERALALGAPESESWRAAFGLTVTLVWLYIEMLRILAILRGDS